MVTFRSLRSPLRRDGPEHIGEVLGSKRTGSLQPAELCVDLQVAPFAFDLRFAACPAQQRSTLKVDLCRAASMLVVDGLNASTDKLRARCRLGHALPIRRWDLLTRRLRRPNDESQYGRHGNNFGSSHDAHLPHSSARSGPLPSCPALSCALTAPSSGIPIKIMSSGLPKVSARQNRHHRPEAGLPARADGTIAQVDGFPAA